ncbi:MAG: hypothetical protein HY201_00140 [Nitrospirae bacterium]|nr:hypothetical protein [Candidatus Troglogloeales bacterium]
MIKEQERAELHRAIWQIANDLRGSVDGWAIITTTRSTLLATPMNF